MRPIKMNEGIAQSMAVEMMQKVMALNGKDFRSDSFTYTKTFNQPVKDKIEVNFTAEAYEQMFALINHFDSEVAWEGCVERLDKTHFRIYKIVLYPQEVTGSTVNTDQNEYEMWRQTLPDEIFNHLFFQGHSHVNMATNPSGTDISDQWRTIASLQPTNFQIFMIWNKRHEFYVRVVDMAANVIYEKEDCIVTVGTTDTAAFLAEADKLVKKKEYPSYVNYSAGAGNYNGASVNKGATAASTVYGAGQNIKTSQKTAATLKGVPFKTVTGAAAPKVKGKSNLASYYAANPGELVESGNSSCTPFYEQFDM